MMIHPASEPALNATRPVATPTLGSAYGGRSSTGRQVVAPTLAPVQSNSAARYTFTMADVPQTHRSSLLWVGFLLALAALLSNAIFFINPPGQKALPWLSLVVAIIPVIL